MTEKKTAVVQIGSDSREYPLGTSYETIAKDHQDPKENDIVLVWVNGRLRELHKCLEDDCRLSFVTTGDKIGFQTYRRSMVLLLMKAVYHEGGHEQIEKVGVHFAVSGGVYCTVKGNVRIDKAFLDKVKTYMRRLVDAGIPIEKQSLNTDDAITLFQKYGMKDKEKLFHYRRVSKVNLYSIDDFEDYNYGFMVPNTSYLKYFDLKLYDDGFVLLMPGRREPKKIPPFAPQRKIFQVQKESMEWGEMLEIPTVGALNDYIVHKDIHDLILIQEALQEQKIAQIARQIAEHREKKLIMIAGPSSSGKTTFSHRLTIQLSAHGLKPHPIAVDDYFINREDTPRDAEGNHDFECLEALDVALFQRDMAALLEGKRVEIPHYNFKTGFREYRGNYKQLGPDDILVIEGIHCLNPAMTTDVPDESKFRIYISALTQLNIDEHNRIPTTDGRLLRRIVRDARTRGTSAKDTIAMWESVRRGEEFYIFPFQEEADVMFNSALIYEFAALKIYAEPLLFGIGKAEPEYQEAKRLLKFLDYFVGIPDDNIPSNSLLREFVGGGCYRI